MAKQQKAAKKAPTTNKKMLANMVTNQLNDSLTSLKVELGDKKFGKRIKRAAKKLVAGIKNKDAKKAAPKAVKAVPVKKKIVKRAVKK